MGSRVSQTKGQTMLLLLQPTNGNPDAIGYEGATVLDAQVSSLAANCTHACRAGRTTVNQQQNHHNSCCDSSDCGCCAGRWGTIGSRWRRLTLRACTPPS